jgi:CRP-like cAMP-binding protein
MTASEIDLSIKDIARHLADTPLFSGLNETDQERLARVVRITQLRPKETLFSRGNDGDELFIVVEGIIRIGALSEEGRDVTLNLVKAGQIFGEIAALDGSERTADATAVDRVVLLGLPRTHLLEFIARDPEAGMRLIATMCDRLRWVSGLLDDSNFLDARGRLAKRLVTLGQMFGRKDVDGAIRIMLRLSQQDLASHVGISREHVNKLIGQWVDEGVLLYQRGKITLIDPGSLANQS